MMNKKDIKNVRDIVDEYLKCKNSFPYFCKNYVIVDDKETICKRCDNYEFCNIVEIFVK